MKKNIFKKVDSVEQNGKNEKIDNKEKEELEKKILDNAKAELKQSDSLENEISKPLIVKGKYKDKLVKIDIQLALRLDKYMKTKASRIESANYIINLALDEWLKKRDF
ncbi:hypothetical protein OM160_001841 [Campylobacter coli]|nr:hypothetical protein [Campylobacter coli]EKA9800412.1 hypothetical protein [Campylobacter coli]